MMKDMLKNAGPGKKLSQLSALLSLFTLIVYTIYGIVYIYFDWVVFLTLALTVVCAEGYVLLNNRASQYLNLASVACASFGMGLFFLNSYPVWADRLNNISMYGSRGTLFPVISIIVLVFASAIMEIVSCFHTDGKDVSK